MVDIRDNIFLAIENIDNRSFSGCYNDAMTSLIERREVSLFDRDHPRYKWIALSNTTLGMLMATISGSSLIIALPAIFRGIKLNPLDPGNFSYLLWILMGYLLISAVLVVPLGKLGDMYGRVRVYNLGFVVFTLASVLLSLIYSHGSTAALEIIVLRLIQAVGASMLMANSAAILTDAFPHNQRGLAMGTNMMAAVAGQFIGLIVGGALASVDWRWVFLINVPVGIVGTIWAYVALKDQAERLKARLDFVGNFTFALGLVLVLIGITYGIQPYGSAATGWTNPLVISLISIGMVVLVVFVAVESKVRNPMFRLALFKIPTFASGNFAGLLAALAQGGLMFLLVMWLQGIWLPLHGYSFEHTPLWGGIYLLPLTAGFLISGPISGFLSDKLGHKLFSFLGLFVAGLSFLFLFFIPVNFDYLTFSLVLFLNGLAFAAFTAPNTAAVMNSVPAQERGVASGMRVTFRNTGTPLSIGVFFTLMILGLAHATPPVIYHSLVTNHVDPVTARKVSSVSPLSYLFAAFLGYNPMRTLLGNKLLSKLPSASAKHLTSSTYFPHLISSPFESGLHVVLVFAISACLIGALISLVGKKRDEAN